MPKEFLHDAHKKHPLVFRDTGKSFCCDGCNCPGVGSRYRCNTCDFNLHEFCATCPPTASLAFHGHLPLTFAPAVYPGQNPRKCFREKAQFYCPALGKQPPHQQHIQVYKSKCDLCVTIIEGMHYSCRPCDFDVHPICSQLPAAAVSPLHPEHLVVLTVAAPMACSRCGTVCSWRYQCALCKVNLHPRCLLGSDKTPLGIPKEDRHRSRGFFW